MPPAPRRVGGLVLAAGASRRMGSPKALLPLEGETYLGRVLTVLTTAGLDPVAAVLGADADRIWEGAGNPGVMRIDHPEWAEGMLSSWCAGLERLTAVLPSVDAAVVALVDSPRFSPATVRALVAARRRTGASIVIPRYGGHDGHPVLVGRETWSEFARAPRDEGARAVIRAVPERVLAVTVDDPWILHDADTPEEHEQLSRGLPPGDR